MFLEALINKFFCMLPPRLSESGIYIGITRHFLSVFEGSSPLQEFYLQWILVTTAVPGDITILK